MVRIGKAPSDRAVCLCRDDIDGASVDCPDRSGAHVRLALAGDTMLGRHVAARLETEPGAELFSDGIAEVIRGADAFVLNLECAVSDRGDRWPDPHKPFFFRAPPVAVEALTSLGVDAVTLANNHALDYGREALLDTIHLLTGAGIAVVGAGRDEAEARRPRIIERAGTRIGIVGVTDHPAAYAADVDVAGVAYADLRHETPRWLLDTVADLRADPDVDVVMVAPHWGPNMVEAPLPHVRRVAVELLDAGATLVAGHSAHVFHGVVDRVLYDLGDFLDDYAVDPVLRNDLGLLVVVTIEERIATRVEAVPIALDCCHTRLADADEWAWIADRFRRACAALGTDTHVHDDRLVVEWGSAPTPSAVR